MKKNEIKECKIENTKKIVCEEFRDKLDELIQILIQKYNDNQVLKEIPYVKIFMAFLNDCKSYSDLEKTNKLIMFFDECKDTDVTKVKEFMDKLDEKITGKRLFDYITGLDDDRKCILAGRIYKHLIEERDHPDTFYRIANSIKACYYPDLKYLAPINEINPVTNNGENIDKDIVQNLFNYGFLINIGINGGNVLDDSGGIMYSLSNSGEMILKCLPRAEISKVCNDSAELNTSKTV